MMKLNKDTFEVEFFDTLTCFCFGGGDDEPSGGSDGGSSNQNRPDPSFYDNERPGLQDGNRPVGGTTNVFQGSSQPNNNNDSDPSPPPLPPQSADLNFYDDLAAAAAESAANVTPTPPPPPPPVRPLPDSGDSGAELARQLINQAAQESLANPDRPTPINQVAAAPGRNDPMSGFFADAYEDLYGGTPPGTGMATIFGGGPLGSLFNTPNPADAQAFNIGQLQRMVQQTGTGTIDPNTGAVTGVQAGPGTLSMNSLGGIVYSGRNDPNYEGPFANLVRGTAGQNMSGGDDGGSSQPASQPPATVDPGTTTPEVIDDLAANYLLNPYYLYSGRGNLYQPYGYAGGTLVDLLQTRGMTQPQQAAPNLNIFGNPRDFV